MGSDAECLLSMSEPVRSSFRPECLISVITGGSFAMCLSETAPPLFANARSSLGRLVSISLDHLIHHLGVEIVQVVTRLPVKGKLKQDAVTRRSPRFFKMFRRGWAADTEQSSLLLLRSQGSEHL